MLKNWNFEGTKSPISNSEKTILQTLLESVIFELILPWQAISSCLWLVSGILCSKSNSFEFLRDWTFIPLLLTVFFARAFGMCLNRLFDNKYDAKNPRTLRRSLPSGRTTVFEVVVYAAFCLFLFVSFCCFFSSVALKVCAWVTFLIGIYSFTKRFTYLCHFVLGLIHGSLPIVGSIWLTSSISLSSALMGVAAFFAISGTDILYAISDEEFDKKQGLYSIPACFGEKKALNIAFFMHIVALIFLSLIFQSIWGFFVWSFFVIYILNLWFLLLGKKELSATLFSRFFMIFPCGTFFSLLAESICKVLLLG